MRLTLDGDWTATVTDEPLRSTPRFDFPGQCVRIAEYADVEGWQRFLGETFGSQEWLWDAPDELRFDRAGRELVGAGFRLPYECAAAEDSARVPVTPAVRPGGLRADEARDFRLDVATELCRATGDTELTCMATSMSSTSRWRPASASLRTWRFSSSTEPSSAGASPTPSGI
ncbi:hypothetical protein ACWDO6_08790 [Streptomyces sp. NPDC003674]